MVKGNPKSSASSATRKKHAKKTATPDEPSPPLNASQKRPKTKAERKLLKKEPRVKMYIPPVKPAPVQPDPLETTGLARTLPADLLVVLRNISKKAQVTKIRALEELQTGWVEKCIKDKEDSLASKLVEMLPVWVCSFLNLFLGIEENIDLHLKVTPCLCTVSPPIASRSLPCCLIARFVPPYLSCTRSDPVFPSRNSISFSN
jgi:E3 ubiquitin-protein ligase listerin